MPTSRNFEKCKVGTNMSQRILLNVTHDDVEVAGEVTGDISVWLLNWEQDVGLTRHTRHSPGADHNTALSPAPLAAHLTFLFDWQNKQILIIVRRNPNSLSLSLSLFLSLSRHCAPPSVGPGGGFLFIRDNKHFIFSCLIFIYWSINTLTKDKSFKKLNLFSPFKFISNYLKGRLWFCILISKEEIQSNNFTLV